jgi:multiple sugar transport system permease protein
MSNLHQIPTRLLHILLVLALTVFGGFPIYWMATTALSLNSELYNRPDTLAAACQPAGHDR